MFIWKKYDFCHVLKNMPTIILTLRKIIAIFATAKHSKNTYFCGSIKPQKIIKYKSFAEIRI
jgi:hypothetical protein